jgi:indolepyruvate ferredoxin oxidoreductase, beta subunit
MARSEAVTIAILAMGGEGGGVLSDWIVDLAEHAGYDVQATSVPGVAQRTGSTIYYLEIFPRVLLNSDGRQPVLALMPVPGELDVVIASELMEAGRAVQRGFVTPDRTTLLASTHRVYSMTEKTAMADGRVDSEKILETCSAAARRFVRRDFAHIAEETGSVISAAFFGALAATHTLPFDRAQCENAIRRGGVGVETSLAAFAAGFESQPIHEEKDNSTAILPIPQSLAVRMSEDFPAPAHEILLAGVGRLVDYQDQRYASAYLDLLMPIRDADHGDFLLLKETARYLALWMSYEDAIRVADLKIRRARFERIYKDVRVAPGQLLQIREFLHPRAQEIADILPGALSRWILGSRIIRRVTRHGRIVHTTSIRGFLQLYMLARLRPLRRKSLRFERERRKMGDWLRTVAQLAPEDYALAVQVAECPRLLKGYGDTHQLGERNFDAIMAAIPNLRATSVAATRVKQLREAALADDTGEKLTEMLGEVAR